MSSSSVTAFLAEFVDPALHDRARDAMSALFAQLHLTLARNFFDTYSSLAPSVPPPAPAPAPAPVKKKKTEVQALPCSAVTAKGEACPRRCCAEAPETFCSAHLAQSLKPQKAPAEPKPISKKAARVAAPNCTGKTAKNGSCTRKCCAESDVFCSAHLAKSLKEPKDKTKAKKADRTAATATKKTKAAKPVKPVPTHNHALTEEAEANCDLCQSHGNTADPDLTDTQFEEISGDLQSRLKSILSNLHEVEEEEEEEETEEKLEEDLALESEEESDLAQYEACDTSEEDEEEEEEETE